MGPDGADCRVVDANFGVVDTALHETRDIPVAFVRNCPAIGDELVLARKAAFGWTQATVGPASGPLRLTLQPDGRLP